MTRLSPAVSPPGARRAGGGPCPALLGSITRGQSSAAGFPADALGASETGNQDREGGTP